MVTLQSWYSPLGYEATKFSQEIQISKCYNSETNNQRQFTLAPSFLALKSTRGQNKIYKCYILNVPITSNIPTFFLLMHTQCIFCFDVINIIKINT